MFLSAPKANIFFFAGEPWYDSLRATPRLVDKNRFCRLFNLVTRRVAAHVTVINAALRGAWNGSLRGTPRCVNKTRF